VFLRQVSSSLRSYLLIYIYSVFLTANIPQVCSYWQYSSVLCSYWLMSQSSACYLDLGQESVHNAGYTGLPPTYTCLPHVMATQADSASTRYLPAPRHGPSGRFSLDQVLACPTSWPLRQIQLPPGTFLPHVMATHKDSASTRYLPAPRHGHSGRFSLDQVLACPTSWPLGIFSLDQVLL
jgi:hypothetical protein